MKIVKPALASAAALALLLTAGPALAEMKGEANLFLGMKDYSEDDFENIPVFNEDTLDTSSATEYGLGFSFGNVDWPVMIAVDVLMASDDDSTTYEFLDASYTYKAEIDTTELNLGVRKFWTNHEKFHPYVGGGLAWIDAEAELCLSGEFLPRKASGETLFEASDSDSGIGYWLNGGVLWRLGKGFQLGFDVRYSDADAEFELDEEMPGKQEDMKEKFDTGGVHYGLLVGYRW